MNNTQVLSKKCKNFPNYLVDFIYSTILGELLGQVLHELNNPLQVVLGFAQDLQENFPKNSEYYQDISLIIEESRKCCQIIKSVQLLQKAPNENGYQDIKLILEKITPLLQYKARKKNVQLKKQLPANVELIQGSNNAVDIAILSTLLLAMDRSKENGALTISTSMTTDTVTLEVQFTPGISISNEPLYSRKEFFELFENFCTYRFDDIVGKYLLIFPRIQ